MTHNAHNAIRTDQSSMSSTDPLQTVTRDFDVEAQGHPQDQSADKRVHIVEPMSATSSQDGGREIPALQHLKLRTDSVLTKSSYKTARRRGRTDTANVAYSAVDMGRTTGWTPGQEPGLNIDSPASGDVVKPTQMTELCEITCVDYSVDNMSMVNLDNTNLQEHLDKPAPDWAQVRWINVNGLSQDVVEVLGRYKKLHPLALEDLMNTRSRTKADWYSDHTFIILPLQKLVKVESHHDDSSDDSDGDSFLTKEQVDGEAHQGENEMETETHFMSESERRYNEDRHKKKRKGAIQSLMQDIFKSKKKKDHHSKNKLEKTSSFRSSKKVTVPWVPRRIRSLQQYHGGPNFDRIAFFERNAVLSVRGLGVSVEQVSLFLTADNTVISFFEFSAQDIETPIIRRLQTAGTILRQSGDASMLMQSILDTIIDLAIPVTTAYQDTLGDLELEVLTDPDISESKILYILTSEIAVLRNAIAPVASLISALKDHKSKADVMVPAPSRSGSEFPDGTGSTGANMAAIPRPGTSRHASYFYPFMPQTGVTISPLTVTYLGDVEDHTLLIQNAYDQMRRSADNLVDLIFNTVSAYQNESMKQLTIVTCFFLPLTFLTGYFGQNFHTFPALDNSDTYFWAIATPVSVVVFILLLRDKLARFIVKWANKALIVRVRKRRLEHTA